MTERESPEDTGLVGTVLADRYRIVRRLGEGAMGTVYLGEHLRFGRLDAIKVLRAGMERDREATDRFLRGARNASRINHPNVCTVYDFGDTGEGPQFLAMEYVEGDTLADILEEEGRLPLDRAIHIARQTASALDAAHDMGIVHRDLKPGNVMLAAGRDGRDQVKVVDFDIAKGSAEGEGAEVTRTGFVVGTPEYMSPEQLIGDPLDGRSDIYSLALLFVRTLTGRLPVRAESTQDLMVERLTQEPLTLADIAPDLELPPRVQAALDHALQRRRDDRPATAGAFAAALGETGTATAAPATDRATVAAGADDGSAASRAAGPPPNGPGRAKAAGGGAVPPTAIGRTPADAPAPLAAPTLGRSRLALWVGGALALAVIAFGVVQMIGGGEAPDSALPPAEQTAGPAGPTDPADDDPPSTDTGEAATDSAAQPTADPIDDPVRTDPDDDPPPTVDPEVAVRPPLRPAAEVEDQLFRQLTALTDRPETGVFRAARDTAALAWEESRHPDAVRALAAYVTASSFEAEDRRDDALAWARRATELAPGNRGYQALLDALGGRP
ncbi:serine/threonine-protein kinase [Gemmatimonadota bacterium Y43]|uniref:serine/threonine-protein kinase n=1 Tax=Gaopeijia maritima TaxID=3119007 RepID=UPI00328F8A08